MYVPFTPLCRCVQESSRVRDDVKYASSLAKAGSVAVRGIYWDPSMDATSIKTAQGLVFPVRLHNSFLLEDPRILLAGEDLWGEGGRGRYCIVETLSELWPPVVLYGQNGFGSPFVLKFVELPTLVTGPNKCRFCGIVLFASVLHDPFRSLPGKPAQHAADVMSSESHDGAIQEADAVPQVEKLCTPAVEHTRGHVSRLRGMVRERSKSPTTCRHL